MTHSSYRRYLLLLLLVTLAFNQVDRLALGLLLQDIKVDLVLTDTQLGMLSGIAFALFYSVLGIPVARWADRGNRITIISATTALWSAAVAFCGVAANFVQLLLIRIGVAVGEAGCIPPAHSLISDHFSRTERPRAFAIYMLGGPLSALIGYFLAGRLNELYGWRVTFILLGIPGLVLAALVRLTLIEPRNHVRGEPSVDREPQQRERTQPGFKDVLVILWTTPTFRHLVFAFAVMSFFSYGISKWQPAFFVRSYGLRTGELGAWFAAVYGLGGLIGTYCGGLVGKLAANRESVQLKVMATAWVVLGVCQAGAYLASNYYWAFALIGLATLGGTITNAPMFALIQSLVPPRMRATSVALILLCANLIGMGLGPLAAGILSDAFQPRFHAESLRLVLLALCPGYLWVTWHVWHASKTVDADMNAARVEPAKESVPPALLEESWKKQPV